MNRRDFLSSSALTSLAAAGIYAADPPSKPLQGRPYRRGWYGKCRLFRLIQVSPVEVVALCDVDRTMLNEAARSRPAPAARPTPADAYGDYREMLRAGELDIVLIGRRTTGTRCR